MYITSRNVRNNHLDLSNPQYVDREFHDQIYPRCRPDLGDVLLTKDGASTGNVTINTISEPFSLLSSVCLIKTEQSDLDPAFLKYYLQSPDGLVQIVGQMSGAAIRRIILRDIKAASISLPDLAVQRRIVAILDEAFEGIATAKANAEKSLQNVRELFASTLAKIFSADWPCVRIDDACQSIMDCVNKTAPTVSEATPYKMIRTTNVRNGVVSLVSVNYVFEDVYKVWTRRQVPLRGDVILTREAPMGEVGMLESDELVFLGQRLVSYRAEPTKLDGRFLLYALQSERLQRQIHALASGSTVQHMRVPDSKNLQLPLPDLQPQREAVSMLDAMREQTKRLGAIYERKLAALEELKQSLLRQAFTGALVGHFSNQQMNTAA